jgi:hypothetical protein
MKRIVKPELLDMLPPDDPRAVRSRHDLHRVNWWMRNHIIMTCALKENLVTSPTQIIELGAGDGRFLLRVAHKLCPGSRNVKVTLLDWQKNVSAETLAAFVECGWQAEAIVADVFDWTPIESESRVVVANLFLHHFEENKLAELFRKISQTTNLFIAVEPHRSALPSLVVPLLRLIGCNDVTRHDAVISIRAGFANQELSTLWPDKTKWQLNERRAGLFSHLFIARRRE